MTRVALLALLFGTGLFSGGCSRVVPPDALVLSQTPHTNTTAPTEAADALDLRYPAGSRVVLSAPPFNREICVLSEGLFAAGAPAVSYDGARVVFAGKAKPESEWQIYEAGLRSGQARLLTAQPGGAIEPAFLPNGSVVFVSPVPKPGVTSAPPALYITSAGGRPQQLTFNTRAVRAPTLLSDGRILFVSEAASPTSNSVPRCMLYTINSDGTELTAFAAPLDRVTGVERPRQLPDGRVVFITKTDLRPGGSAEFVRLARPFTGREPLLADAGAPVCSVQPINGGGLLLCAKSSAAASSCWAPFRIEAGANALGQALLTEPIWNTLEAVQATRSERPMGRLSLIDPTRNTGQILCLNANDTRYVGQPAGAPSSRIRVLTETRGMERLLGEVPVQPDGSFLAEVPADVPLGFEAVDEKGCVLRRVRPVVWVRPGENRSCRGCHAPPHRSPENHRPLAVSAPVSRLETGTPGIAKK